MAIYRLDNNTNRGYLYIGGGYKDIGTDKIVESEKMYSLSVANNGSKMFFKENEDILSIDQVGNIEPAINNTVFAIGTNPAGQQSGLVSGQEYANIEVYSVRIYNRGLTEEEMKFNYEIDKQRFGI